MTTTRPMGTASTLERFRLRASPLVERLAQIIGLDRWPKRRLQRLRAASEHFSLLAWIISTGIAVWLIGILAAGQPFLLALAMLIVGLGVGTAGILAAIATAQHLEQRVEIALMGSGLSHVRLRSAMLEETADAYKTWTGTGKDAVFRFDGGTIVILLEGDPRQTPHRIRLVRGPDGPFAVWLAKRTCCEPWEGNPDLAFGTDRDLRSFADTFVALAEYERESHAPKKTFDPSLN